MFVIAPPDKHQDIIETVNVATYLPLQIDRFGTSIVHAD
jgi:hypothetical protein